MNRVRYRQVAITVTHAELFTIFCPEFSGLYYDLLPSLRIPTIAATSSRVSRGTQAPFRAPKVLFKTWGAPPSAPRVPRSSSQASPPAPPPTIH